MSLFLFSLSANKGRYSPSHLSLLSLSLYTKPSTTRNQIFPSFSLLSWQNQTNKLAPGNQIIAQNGEGSKLD
jgi:hypothetical protein